MKDLLELRAEIDRLDEEWLSILAKRFAATREVGRLKATGALPSIDPSREAEQEARLRSLAEKYGVSPDLAHDVLRLIIGEVVTEHEAAKRPHE